MEMPNNLTIQALFESIRNQQYNLGDIIGRLLKILDSLPEGKTRDKLLDEISCLVAISQMMRKLRETCISQRDDGIDSLKD
jgi:hypothetical protein